MCKKETDGEESLERGQATQLQESDPHTERRRKGKGVGGF